MYYTPGIQVQLVSLGKLEGQGWDIHLQDSRMVLRNPAGDIFADIKKVHNIYLVELRVIPQRTTLVAWMDDHRELTYLELVEHLLKVTMTVMARGGNGMEVTLMTLLSDVGVFIWVTI